MSSFDQEPIGDHTDSIVEECIVVLGRFSTETLRRVADNAADQNGWLPKMIREYIETWRT